MFVSYIGSKNNRLQFSLSSYQYQLKAHTRIMNNNSKVPAPGVVNLGYKYEDAVSGYFALKLLQDNTITSFSFNLNPSGYDKFDDLIIDIEYENKEMQHFAIQLKHKDEGTGKHYLTAADAFDGKIKKKLFGIETYRQAYHKQGEDIQQQYKFILFTNAKFKDIDKDKKYEIDSVNNPFNNLFELENVYRFQRKDAAQTDDPFFDKFFLFDGQKDYHGLRNSIVTIFKNEFYSDEAAANLYLTFFSDLRSNCYSDSAITRDAVIIKLKSILLENLIIKTSQVEQREDKIGLIEKALQQFDVTLLKDTYETSVRNLWKYSLPERIPKEDLDQLETYKIIPKKNSLTDNERKLLYLCQFRKKPLFVKAEDKYEKTITKIVRLCKTLRQIELKFVLVDTNMTPSKFDGLTVFHNLSDLQNETFYQEMIGTLKISLQGRNAVSIARLKTDFDVHLDSLITPDEVFQWLTGDLLIGAKIDNLPEPYIDRHLIKSKLNCELLHKVCEEKVTIIQCNGNLKLFKKYLNDQNTKIKIVKMKDSDHNLSAYQKPLLVLTDKEFSIDNQQYHCLKLIVEDNCFVFEWIKNKVSQNALELFDNQVNAVCDDPGFGKTTLMKFLATKSPANYWIISVSLKQVETIFQSISFDEILNCLFRKVTNIHSNLDSSIFIHFKDAKRIIFFFDGLDEVRTDCLPNVVKFMTNLIKEEYKIWIFSTKIRKGILENELAVSSIYCIEPLTKEHQINYVRKKLENLPEASIERIISILFEEKTNVYANILKVPLYLYIVTEILSNKKGLINLEDILTITKMYSSFIDGELQHYLHKSNYDDDNHIKTIINFFIHYYKKEYTIAALQSCLEPAIFDLLKITSDKLFLERIREDCDILGLINKVNEDDTVVFIHNSFAEYFAAIWLAENFSQIPTEAKSFIFHPNYSGIRYFFDVKLAENHPLHLAVLNLDVPQVRKLTSELFNDVDEELESTFFDKVDVGGRSPLHLASSMGRYHPVLKKNCASQDMRRVQNKSYSKHEEIINCLLKFEDKDKLLDKDLLFGWNSFEYADASASLYSLEKLSETNLLDDSYLKNCTDLFSLCYYCVTFGYINIFTKLIQLKTWSNIIKIEEQFPKPFLHLALENDREQFATFLIEHGVDLKKVDNQKRTALHTTAVNGNCKVAELLLNKNLEIEAEDITGMTPLQFAARMGHLDVLKLLVEKGANFNTRDLRRDRTPLHKAAYTGKIEIIRYLLKLGVDINTVDKNRKNALQRATEMGHYETVVFLIEEGIKVNVIDKTERTPLHYAASEGHTDIVKHLVVHKANVLLKDEFGNTALNLAIARGHDAIVKILEDEEQKLGRKSPETFERSPLHQRAHSNDLEKIQEILEDGGADIEEIDSNEETILHIASLEGYRDVVQYLLQKGANTGATNIHGRVPLHLAAVRGHVDVVKLLLNKGQDNCSDKYGMSPIQKAAHKAHLAVVEAFINAGVDINTKSGEGATALHSAAHGENLEFIDWLLDHDADVSIKSNDGKTCLHVAAQKGKFEAVERLLKKSKHIIDETDNSGRTAVHWAAEKGYKKTIECLVSAGANIDITDNANKTPIDIARGIEGREGIVKYLQNRDRKTY